MKQLTGKEEFFPDRGVEMYKVYDVQTIYGSYQKTFQRKHHAEDYFRKLADMYDRDLVEMYEREISLENFVLEDLED